MYLQTNYSERFPASPILMQELRGQHCSASRAGTLAKVGVQIELTRLGQPLIPKKKKKRYVLFVEQSFKSFTRKSMYGQFHRYYYAPFSVTTKCSDTNKQKHTSLI